MRNSLRFFLIVFTALALLAAMSVCPWGEWTGGRLKDFNLLGDVIPHTPAAASSPAVDTDPELASLESELRPDSTKALSVAVSDTLPPVPHDFVAPTRDGSVLIEDYSPDATGIAHLAATLRESSDRKVRIAFVGDSYIEGDILAQDIRAGLQDRFGGCGVGYVGAFSQFPGFRNSVHQFCSGWDETEISKMNSNDPLRTILGHYHTAQEHATTQLKASAKPAHADSWHRTTALFVAPDSGTITLTEADKPSVSYNIGPSADIQAICHDSPTADIRLSTDINGLNVLGIWLEGDCGIVLDDISLRGNSGISHRRLSETTTMQMRQWIDYDIIILEFGLNAASIEQTDYTAYGRGMAEVIDNLKNLYPNATILMLGVGDRAIKRGTEYVSMPTLPALVKAQRNAARVTGTLFYDTRAAMGGDGAAADWHTRKLVNADYVHLNHRGGKQLAEIFLKSLDISLQ